MQNQPNNQEKLMMESMSTCVTDRQTERIQFEEYPVNNALGPKKM